MKWTAIVAIVAIAALEIVALCKGVDGVALSAAIGSIAGLGGYQIKAIIDKRKGGKE